MAELHDFESTVQRFESLRGYGMLPRGRENADRRLDDRHIASAVLGFSPSQPGWAGHVSLILSGLQPVGGSSASFQNAPNLGNAVTKLVGSKDAVSQLVNVSLSIISNENDDDYFAQLLFNGEDGLRVTSYVSKHALTLFTEGAEHNFDGERELTPSARQLVLGKDFFRKLFSEVELSRIHNLPFKSDWREYENEEEKQEFHNRLGARCGSNFLNLGVDTQVTWPKEPTRVQFSGHHLVLFPKTKDNSYSISVDLATERLNSDDARTLINRFLSLLSWCDNKHAILRSGWFGNPVPLPVPRRNLAFQTAHDWLFERSLPKNEDLLKCLAYYREGLNAREAGNATFQVLSFYKVFEIHYPRRPSVEKWVTEVFDDACSDGQGENLIRFHEDRGEICIGEYVARNCRVATAHAARDVPSDVDSSLEIRRLENAVPIIQSLARHFIKTKFSFSASSFSDELSPK